MIQPQSVQYSADTPHSTSIHNINDNTALSSTSNNCSQETISNGHIPPTLHKISKTMLPPPPQFPPMPHVNNVWNPIPTTSLVDHLKSPKPLCPVQHPTTLPESLKSTVNGGHSPNIELPLPFNGQAQYSRQIEHAHTPSSITDLSSSTNSIRSSPIHTPLIDALERQGPIRHSLQLNDNHRLTPNLASNYCSSGPASVRSSPVIENSNVSPPISSHSLAAPSVPPLNQSWPNYHAPTHSSQKPPIETQFTNNHNPSSSHFFADQTVSSSQPVKPSFVQNHQTHSTNAAQFYLHPPNTKTPTISPNSTSQFPSPPMPPFPQSTNAYSTFPTPTAPPLLPSQKCSTPLIPTSCSTPSLSASHNMSAPHLGDNKIAAGAQYFKSASMGHRQMSESKLDSSFGAMNVSGNRPINLIQERTLIAPSGVTPPTPLSRTGKSLVNCSPDVMRCTLTHIPQCSSLLAKSRLPLGILMHPFRDLTSLPVIQASVIVRCRNCRTYINPFVAFPDSRRWKCNVCFRVNDLPEEFQYDPVSKIYGEPQRRPEIRSATVEFIAPTEYMLRPPQPSVYIFIIDVSINGAGQDSCLHIICKTIAELLHRLPGDGRTQIGFITYDSGLHFYKLDGEIPRMMIVKDVEDVFIPDPEGLVVNLCENKDLIFDLLSTIPGNFMDNTDTGNCLGPALQAASKIISTTGGRITVFNASLPNMGVGALKSREDTHSVASTDKTFSANLTTTTDFYKTLALECSGQQIGVDIFQLGSSPSDLASLSCMSRYSSGSLYHYPNIPTPPPPSPRHTSTQTPSHQKLLKGNIERDRFRQDLTRYLIRKVGLEAVMRIRCTRGITFQSFYGNFFVRSTDLLTLANCNPDAGFAIHMKIEDSLSDLNTACFQTALLYTSSKGERRIRVHTLCLPLTKNLNDVFQGADQQAIASLIAKMAVDRVISTGLTNAREALINSAVDVVSAYGSHCVSAAQRAVGIYLPYHLRLLPLCVLALLRSPAFLPLSATPGLNLDTRLSSLDALRILPVSHLMSTVYTRFYPLHRLCTMLNDDISDDTTKDSELDKQNTSENNGESTRKSTSDGGSDEEDFEDDEDEIVDTDIDYCLMPQMHLTARNVERHGAYLMDTGANIYLLLCGNLSSRFCQAVFNVSRIGQVPEGPVNLPPLKNRASLQIRSLVRHIQFDRPMGSAVVVVHNEGSLRKLMIDKLIEDRTESTMSYQEFIQYIQRSVRYTS